MKNYIKTTSAMILIASLCICSCTKTEYTFGDIKTPANLTLDTKITGVNAGNPDGNGSGEVEISSTSENTITYKIDFGDGTTQLIPSGNIKYKYTNPGTFTYTITVSAVGTGGVTSVLSKQVKVYVAFEIPAEIVESLTGTGSKVWLTDKDAPGNVGVGPADGFTDSYYSALPNQRDACLYDDEITFSKDANNNIFISVDNKGASSLTKAATPVYGFSGEDGCYPVVTTMGKLSFTNATSASTPDMSTRIQFKVPGNGIVNFGTGGSTYEIMKITPTTVYLRNIGADGLAWYQKLKVK